MLIKNGTCHQNTNYIYYKEELTLTQGLLLGSITVLQKEYIVSFKVKPTQFSGGWRSVLHLTLGKNVDKYGNRNPGVWFHESDLGTLFISSAVNGDYNYNFNTSLKLPLNKWSFVKIYQSLFDGKYWYAVDLNDINIHKVQNTDPRDFNNMLVYASDPWYPAQDGLIAELLIISGNTNYIYHKEELTLTQGFLLGSITVLQKEYSVSFKVKPTQFWSEWRSVLHLTLRNNIGNYGDRNPGVWFHKNGLGSLHICAAVIGNFDYNIKTDQLPLNEWSFVKIYQSLLNGKYWYAVDLNGINIHNVENTDPRDFNNMLAYASNLWDPAQDGSIAELLIISGNTTLWSQLKYWTSCSSSIGFKNWPRECITANIQDRCYGNITEVEECFVFWAQWSTWKSCNDSFGFRNRTRKCIASNDLLRCSGEKLEVMRCSVLWSKWSNWTNCNASIGFMNRTRKCNNTNILDHCFGEDFEDEKCFVLWFEWNLWTNCNASIGFMNRTRKCNNTNVLDHCIGEDLEVEKCFVLWSEWNLWTNCNASIGFMNRTRGCNNTNVLDHCIGKDFEVEECFVLWSEWSNWTSCNASIGFMNKTRECNNTNVLDHCVGKKFGVEECFEDGTWGPWSHSDCSATCGIRIKILNRSCNKPSLNARDCIGVGKYTEYCNDIICTVNGNWSMWSSWLLCNQPCGGGVKARFRSCSNPKPKFAGLDCNGYAVDFKNCTWQRCKGINLNLVANFIDKEYIESYSLPTSTLAHRDKIQDAISKLYTSHKLNGTVNVVVHSMEIRP